MLAILRRSSGFIRFLLEESFMLFLGAGIGLIWANTGVHSYERIAHNHAFQFLVNDIGMVFFFALAAKEVYEAILPGGTLGSPRQAALPLLATIGGVSVPALLYLLGAAWVGRPELYRGWAIPGATDIAFSYLTARVVFGARHPAVSFLLLLAIADDGLGLLILALFYRVGQPHLLMFLALVISGIIVALVFRRRRVSNFWPYILISGPLCWLGFFYGGIHPALALAPVIFMMPHERIDQESLVSSELPSNPLNGFVRFWRWPVEVILGLFGLINAGVALKTIGLGTWLVVVGLLVGKPLGIVLFTIIGRLVGLRLPDLMTMSDLVVLGCAAGVGFTVALFVSTVAFPPGNTLDTVKLGALLSFSAIGVTVIVAKLLGIKPIRAD